MTQPPVPRKTGWLAHPVLSVMVAAVWLLLQQVLQQILLAAGLACIRDFVCGLHD